MVPIVSGSSRYHLKWLHEQIDYYDRKLAHLDKFGIEDSTTNRAKLTIKRGSFEKAARRLAAEGVEFDAKDLPRSFCKDV